MRSVRSLALAIGLSLAGCSDAAPDHTSAEAAIQAPPATAAAAPADASQVAAPTPPKPAPLPDGADCTFRLPEGFEGRVVKWEGECVAGVAHGSGVLRAELRAGRADEKTLLFFGRLEYGDPKLGVIDTPDGYLAGEISGGKVLESADRNVLIRAFREASGAAGLVSKRFKAAGNLGSSAFYAKKARSLGRQLD